MSQGCFLQTRREIGFVAAGAGFRRAALGHANHPDRCGKSHWQTPVLATCIALEKSRSPGSFPESCQARAQSARQPSASSTVRAVWAQ